MNAKGRNVLQSAPRVLMSVEFYQKPIEEKKRSEGNLAPQQAQVGVVYIPLMNAIPNAPGPV